MTAALTRVRIDETAFSPVEIPEEDIIEGTPSMTMGPVWRSPDGGKVSGVARMGPGRFLFRQPYHETTYLLRGRMTVTIDDGTEHVLQAGDLVHLLPGTNCEINVLEAVEDFWVVTAADGPVEL